MSADKHLITFLRQTEAGGGIFRDELLGLRSAKVSKTERTCSAKFEHHLNIL